MNWTIRPMAAGEAAPLSALIRRVMLEVNVRDYPYDYLAEYARHYGPAQVEALTAEGGTLYVAVSDQGPVGCGAVVPDPEHPGGAVIRAVYVNPDHQGEGMGRAIVETLEADPVFLGAERVLVSASITAHRFYRRLGYRYVGGAPVCEEHDHYWMEKFPGNVSAAHRPRPLDGGEKR